MAYREIRNSNDFVNLMKRGSQSTQVLDESDLRTKNNICKKFMHTSCDNPHCIYLHDLSKAIVCRNYLQSGYCSKGNTCNYLHSNNGDRNENKQSAFICKKFREEGYCPEEENCPYKHSKIICKDYEKGFCANGPDCKELHKESIPCRNYLLGFCPKGPNCPFAQ